MQKEKLPKSLVKALRHNRVAHLCIDNQAYYVTRDLQGDARDEYAGWCHHIADVTNQFSNNILTIHVNYEIGNRNFSTYAKNPFFQQNCRTVIYDEHNLTAKIITDKTPVSDKEDVRRADFINPHFHQAHVFFKDNIDAFHDSRLNIFLLDHKIDTLLISGMYLTSCVKATLESALNKGYDTHLLADGVLDYAGLLVEPTDMGQQFEAMTMASSEYWGIPTAHSRTLKNHLKIS